MRECEVPILLRVPRVPPIECSWVLLAPGTCQACYPECNGAKAPIEPSKHLQVGAALTQCRCLTHGP